MSSFHERGWRPTPLGRGAHSMIARGLKATNTVTTRKTGRGWIAEAGNEKGPRLAILRGAGPWIHHAAGGLVYVAFQRVPVAGVAETAQGTSLNLADPLTRDAHDPTNLVESIFLAVLDAEA